MHILSPLLMMVIIALIPFVIIYSLPISISTIVSFTSIVLIFLAGIALFLLMRKKISPANTGTLNPISILSTFLTHEVYLILILFSYFARSVGIKRKSEDIRSSWQTKTD